MFLSFLLNMKKNICLDWLIFGFLVKSQSEHLDKWFNFL